LSTSLDTASVRPFLTRAATFLLIGAVIYAAVYAAAEQVVYRYAQRNRFYQVRTAPHHRYDHVILGASHAAALDYQDMTPRLEAMTGSRIMNLSVVGGGVTVSRILLEYFLEHREAGHLVYVVDSFAFYSRQWNEERLKDSRLFVRAPLDTALAAVLFRHPETRVMALDYLVGFSKINDADRFAPDVHADEGARFTRTYRPVAQIDRQRLAYLYPAEIDPATFARYLGQLDGLLRLASSRGMRLTVIKPPVPGRVYAQLPDEAAFDARLREVLDRNGAAFHDFSQVSNDDSFFYDTDHLNRAGVLNFFEHNLAPLLGAAGA
jgi:hypothetical protein